MRRSFTFLLGLFVTCVLSVAQTAKDPAFAVASIKANKADNPGPSIGFWPGCRFIAKNVTLRTLILYAYRASKADQSLPPDRILGGPPWMDSDRFDVEAAPSDIGVISLQQMPAMLRYLLQDRFQLAAHWDTRDLPTYDLVVRKEGVKIKRSEDQTPQTQVTEQPCSTRPAAKPDVPAPPRTRPNRRGQLLAAYNTSQGMTVQGTAVSMATLAEWLRPPLGRPVIDKTGIAGLYDMNFRYTPDNPPPMAFDQTATPDTRKRQSDAVADPIAPSIFTALQEELGLKLESSKSPFEVLVIDAAQPPIEN